jgi:hypothetical protein
VANWAAYPGMDPGFAGLRTPGSWLVADTGKEAP